MTPPSPASWPLPPRAYFLLFLASGFSGLVYELIWAQYLKLMLGHAAYAQSLVLAVYMAGLGVGAWWCARRLHRWRNPLALYAAVELALAVAAGVFHPLFTGLQTAFFEQQLAADWPQGRWEALR